MRRRRGHRPSGISDILRIAPLPGPRPTCHAHRIRRRTWDSGRRCSVRSTQPGSGSVARTHERPPMWRFFVYSFIGAFVFFVPIEIAGQSSILLDHIVTGIETAVPAALPYVVLVIILAGAMYP